MWVIFDHRRPLGHIMPDMWVIEALCSKIEEPHDHPHINHVSAFPSVVTSGSAPAPVAASVCRPGAVIAVVR